MTGYTQPPLDMAPLVEVTGETIQERFESFHRLRISPRRVVAGEVGGRRANRRDTA